MRTDGAGGRPVTERPKFIRWMDNQILLATGLCYLVGEDMAVESLENRIVGGSGTEGARGKAGRGSFKRVVSGMME